MVNLLKNVFFMGAGMTAMTKEKMDELARKLSEDAKVSEEEGQKVIAELFEQLKNSCKNMDEFAVKVTGEILTKLNVPTRAEYDNLERQVSELQKLIQDKQQERQ